MKTRTLLFANLALWLHVAFPVLAAPLATAFTYQGKLNDGTAPASGSYDLRFTLYDTVVDGSRVGNVLTTEDLAMVGGVFTATLDFGAGVFNGAARWVEIAVRPGGSTGDFTVLNPRQPLSATPYALYALTPAGPQGAQRVKGDTGLTGLQGLAGPTGPTGATGPKGDTGATGAKGDQGEVGAAGAQGVQGPIGLTGLTGTQGAAGAAGPKGDKGDLGLTGTVGPQGVAGAKGDKGDTGAAGTQGVQGPIGLTGLTGTQGAAGATGPKGDKGDAGTTGAAGTSGPQGAKGDKGDTGLTGPQGLAGPAGSTGASGAKGDKGDIGSTGAAGPQGATGAKGDTGLTGPAGAAGPQGIQGVAGTVGPVGPQGPVGPLGPIGLTGAMGNTGAAGPAGAKGVNWRGAWSAATAYALNDAVALNGSSWQAKLGNTASAPFEGSATWDLLAKKGDPGATGLQGPAGAAGATGSQGPIGLTGAAGATGATGPQGPLGPQGPSGAFTPTGLDASFVGGNVGIGTTTPRAKLHVEGGDLLAGAPGQEWIFHTRSNAGSDFLHITDSVDGAFQFQHGLTINKAGNVGIGITSGTNKLEVAGNALINGRLGIGTTAPAFPLEVAGTAQINGVFRVNSADGDDEVFQILNGPNQLSMYGATYLRGSVYVFGGAFKAQGGTSWEPFSDRRLKQDVRAYEPGLNEVLQLRPVRFRYRDDPKRGLTSDHEEVGFIAQEVREIIPDAVTEGQDGYLTLKADPIHWAAINAIQALNAKLESETAALRADVQVKDAELQDLKRQFAELKILVHRLVPANGGAR